MIYESSIYLSDSEIRRAESNGIQALINKMESIKINPSSRQLHVIKIMSERLANIDAEKSSENLADHRGVFYSRSKGMWIAQVKVKGKSTYIKGSKDKQSVINAYERFVINMKKD